MIDTVTMTALGAVRYMRSIIGCKYSQEKRLEKNYYDCSSAIARAYMDQGKQWPYRGPVPISCDLVYDDELRLIWPASYNVIGRIMGGMDTILKAIQPGDIQFICTDSDTTRANRITHVAMVLDEETIGHARGKAYGVCTNTIGKYSGRICAVARYDPAGPLRKEMKGRRTMELQQKLVSLGYRLSVDGDYGSETETAVRELQRSRGLRMTGEADRDLYVSLGMGTERKASGASAASENGAALIITGDTVNIRSGPGIAFDIVHTARKRELYETVEGWLPVVIKGEVFWISERYAERYVPE